MHTYGDKIIVDAMTGKPACPCLTGPSSSNPCRHMCAYLSSQSKPDEIDLTYFHTRWRKRFSLPKGQQLLAELEPLESQVPIERAKKGQGKKKMSKKQQIYKAFMTVAERIAGFVSESSELGDASVKFLEQFESELHAGRIPALAIEAGPVGATFQHVPSTTTQFISDNADYPSHTPGRHMTKRIPNTGIFESAPKNGSSGRRSSKKEPQCSVCKETCCPKKGPQCPKIAVYGSYVRQDMYKALTNYEVTEQHICCAGEWTEAPFDMLWQHVVVRNFYKNALGQKLLSIGTINTSLQ